MKAVSLQDGMQTSQLRIMMSSCFQVQLLELAYGQSCQQDPQWTAGQMWSAWSVNQHNVNRCQKSHHLPKSACECILPWAAVDKSYSWVPSCKPLLQFANNLISPPDTFPSPDHLHQIYLATGSGSGDAFRLGHSLDSKQTRYLALPPSAPVRV